MRLCVHMSKSKSEFDFMSVCMFLLCERVLRVCVYVHECMCAFVRVLRASIMYSDNATASLYQEQLTGSQSRLEAREWGDEGRKSERESKNMM